MASSTLRLASSETMAAADEPVAMAADVATSAIDFFNLSRTDLEALLQERLGEKTYRAEQLFNWVYKNALYDTNQMTNIGVKLRAELARMFEFPLAKTAERQISRDGTRKYLFQVEAGDSVESVMIKQPTRMTLCVSSQVGCAMGCKFCRTATMGLKRNLTTSEIIRQVLGVIEDSKSFDDTFSNIVFMGMGEPFHNIDNVLNALRILTDPQGLFIGPRKITVSTSGLVPAIRKFGQADTGVNLAVSLNATTDEVRSEVMPVNKAYPISELLGALSEFPLKARKLITIEYVMLEGVNTTDGDRQRLPKLLRELPCKLNLIPYNENAGLPFKSPSKEKVASWQQWLNARGIQTTVRWSKGDDISAACGQLATASVKAPAKKRLQQVLPEAQESSPSSLS